MKHLITLVEGEGDREAVPILLKKLLPIVGMLGWNIAPPIEVGDMSKLTRPDKWDNQIARIRIQAQYNKCHGVLILLDLDNATDCPVLFARSLASRLANERLPIPIAVVFARREYEEWIVASLPSIAPKTDLLPNSLRRDYEPECKRGVKEWLAKHLPNRSYRETIHQAEFTRHIDPNLVLQECRSFKRLHNALTELAQHSELPSDMRIGIATPVSAR